MNCKHHPEVFISLSMRRIVWPIVSACLQNLLRMCLANSFPVFRVERIPFASRVEVVLEIASNFELSSYAATARVSIDEPVAHIFSFDWDPCRDFVDDVFAFLPMYVILVCLLGVETGRLLYVCINDYFLIAEIVFAPSKNIFLLHSSVE